MTQEWLNYEKCNPDLIGSIICIDEERTPAWRKGLAVYAIAMILSCDESLACHHIHNWLVLASVQNENKLFYQAQR